MQNEQRFVETMRAWLVSLPQDIKILFEVASDENLERSARELAVGAIIYAISPNDMISADRPDSVISFADDCLLVRLALKRIAAADDEDTEFFKSRFPEFFDTLDDELAIIKESMDDLFDWLDGKVESLLKLEYKSKKVPVYLDDDEASEFLYEEGLGFRTEYPVDGETVGDKLKRGGKILEMIRRRKDEEERNRR